MNLAAHYLLQFFRLYFRAQKAQSFLVLICCLKGVEFEVKIIVQTQYWQLIQVHQALLDWTIHSTEAKGGIGREELL